jgi:hypothetical protein
MEMTEGRERDGQGFETRVVRIYALWLEAFESADDEGFRVLLECVKDFIKYVLVALLMYRCTCKM